MKATEGIVEKVRSLVVTNMQELKTAQLNTKSIDRIMEIIGYNSQLTELYVQIQSFAASYGEIYSKLHRKNSEILTLKRELAEKEWQIDSLVKERGLMIKRLEQEMTKKR